MDSTAYSPTLLETARHNIGVLFEQFHLATGYKQTFVSQCVFSDRGFASRFRERGLNVETYDLFAGRMSGLWPRSHPWPEGVPRPAPIPLNDAGARLMAEREASRVTPPPVENWPDDIPQPAAF